LEEAKDRIRKLSEIVESGSMASAAAGIADTCSTSGGASGGGATSASLTSEAASAAGGLAEVVRQKEEMIHCLQDELIKERLREAENEERIRNLGQKVNEMEQETRRLRESVPENDVASLQEELAAAKLREAEANLALKELRSKVAELSAMWQKHLKRGTQQQQPQQPQQPVNDAQERKTSDASMNEPLPAPVPAAAAVSAAAAAPPSTPKKLLGQLLGGGSDAWLRQEAARLEEELMSVRVAEVDAQAELKERGLRVMELETQNQVIANQLKRQSDDLLRVREALDAKGVTEEKLERQVRESKRHLADLESKMKEEQMNARIREAEAAQRVAELTQKISGLEYKVGSVPSLLMEILTYDDNPIYYV